ADAPRRVELVVPGGELVRQPLPVPAADVVADDAAVHVAEVDVEAGVPLPLAADVIAAQTRDLAHRRAEAGRADHRAVRARETTLGNMLLARVLEVVHQWVSDAVGVEGPLDLIVRLLSLLFGKSHHFPRRGTHRQTSE